jgi:hypothetical protein
MGQLHPSLTPWVVRCPEPQVTIKSISLVSQTQVGRFWQWQPVVEVSLGGGIGLDDAQGEAI